MDPVYQVAPDITLLPSLFPIFDAGILSIDAFVLRGKGSVLIDTGMGIDGDAFVEGTKLEAVSCSQPGPAIITAARPKSLEWLSPGLCPAVMNREPARMDRLKSPAWSLYGCWSRVIISHRHRKPPQRRREGKK